MPAHANTAPLSLSLPLGEINFCRFVALGRQFSTQFSLHTSHIHSSSLTSKPKPPHPLLLPPSLSLSLSSGIFQLIISSRGSFMATEKVTPMVLKVDLQCPCCYKKIKKTLCKFPQIRDQVYDEKANEVMITVVCCSPEKIRDKLCYKGGKAIQSIKIIEKPGNKPDMPKEPEKPKPAADKPKAAADKPKEPEKPKAAADKPKAAGKPKEPEKPNEKPAGPEKPKGDGKGDKPGGAPPSGKPGGAPPAGKPSGPPPAEKPSGPPPAEKPKDGPKPEAAAPISAAALQVMGSGPALVHGVPSVFPYVGPSHDGYSAGPYYHGYGFPPPPPPQPLYEAGYYGHGHGYEQGYGYGYGHRGHGHVHRSDNYFSEENPQTCSIM